jgi:acetyl-CoA/propionyl-CoA carboxylase, biotin carboxylase, biotin carboxyl carrier protein
MLPTADTPGATTLFSKVLIANRGEIAVRVARACRELGVRTVAVYSDVDAEARHVAAADESVHLPGVLPAETYLNIEAIVDAAGSTGAEAVHPGYGFLSERAEAAEAFGAVGLTWIGPPVAALRAAGDKVLARRLAESAGVPVVPGTLDPVRDLDEVRGFAVEHGLPLAIKAAAGGGGRGLKMVASTEGIEAAYESAVREATAYFGSDQVYLERHLTRPKHVEIQILSPGPGRAAWLGARDCSMQRRNQKIIEETPPPRFQDLVPKIGESAVRVADECGYVNAGTVEFLIDTETPGGAFYFLEINARLQVEHTITEEVWGIDLVAAQLRIAAGEPVEVEGLEPRGHAIECRINAENPAKRFFPSPGTISSYREPSGPGIRVDSGFGPGDEVSRAYDSLIAKLIAHGADREEARLRMIQALEGFEIEGIATTIPAHRVLLEDPTFVDGSYTTGTVESTRFDPTPAVAPTLEAEPPLLRLWHPAIAGSISAAGGTGGAAGDAVVAPMHGTILRVEVSPGDTVRAGDQVAVLEAMKMETFIAAPVGGLVEDVRVAQGEVVEAGEVVVVLRPTTTAPKGSSD